MIASVSCNGVVPLVLKIGATSARFRHLFPPLRSELPITGLKTGFQEMRHVRGPSPISQRPRRSRLACCLAPRIIGEKAIFFMRSSSLSSIIYSPQSPRRCLIHHAVDSPFTSSCNEFSSPLHFFFSQRSPTSLATVATVALAGLLQIFKNWEKLSRR